MKENHQQIYWGYFLVSEYTGQEHVLEVNGKAGDVVIFTETLTHGTLPWTAKHERRAVLYKFSPGTLSYGSGSHEVSYGDYVEDMAEEERAVMEAPHIRR